MWHQLTVNPGDDREVSVEPGALGLCGQKECVIEIVSWIVKHENVILFFVPDFDRKANAEHVTGQGDVALGDRIADGGCPVVNARLSTSFQPAHSS